MLLQDSRAAKGIFWKTATVYGLPPLLDFTICLQTPWYLLDGEEKSTGVIWCGLCQAVNCILQGINPYFLNECHCKHASNYKIYYFIQLVKLKCTSSEPEYINYYEYQTLFHLQRCNRMKFPCLILTQNKTKKATWFTWKNLGLFSTQPRPINFR